MTYLSIVPANSPTFVKNIFLITGADMSKHSTNKVLGIQCLFCAKDLLTPRCAYFAMALSVDTRKRDHKPILQGLLKNSQQAILADLKNILFPLTIEKQMVWNSLVLLS